MNQALYQNYCKLLQEELIPALGCTEPIAIAFGAATAHKALGAFPTRITVSASGNIIKNVKSVIVPGTDDLKGIEASAVLGVVGGDPSSKLEVLERITPAHVTQARALLAQPGFCTVQHLDSDISLHLIIRLETDAHTAEVEIAHLHTNITRITVDGEEIFHGDCDAEPTAQPQVDAAILTVQDIYAFACTAQLEDITPVLSRQIEYNLAIATEGLQGIYGAAVGKTLLCMAPDDVFVQARAYAAAGSDARMSGCTLPVVINSGSGNQGMAVSLPVIIYAQHLGAPEGALYRALAFANLIAIHQKTGIGRLSAYCGAVSAGCAAGCGIAYLDGASLPVIENTITNTLANVAGIICDGAKPSCAAKIASSIDAALLGYRLAQKGHCFRGGDGVVKGTIEDTIVSISRVGRQGMRSTDSEILQIMME